MANPEFTENKPAEGGESHGGGRSQDEVALELMKFIAVTTGYGKASQGSAGFSGKPSTRSAEEHAVAMELVLEGLHQSSMLSRERTDTGRTGYKDMLKQMLSGLGED